MLVAVRPGARLHRKPRGCGRPPGERPILLPRRGRRPPTKQMPPAPSVPRRPSRTVPICPHITAPRLRRRSRWLSHPVMYSPRAWDAHDRQAAHGPIGRVWGLAGVSGRVFGSWGQQAPWPDGPPGFGHAARARNGRRPGHRARRSHHAFPPPRLGRIGATHAFCMRPPPRGRTRRGWGYHRADAPPLPPRGGSAQMRPGRRPR
jgi:hypothetical protein